MQGQNRNRKCRAGIFTSRQILAGVAFATSALFFSSPASAQITNDQLKVIVQHFHDEYDSELAAIDADFKVNDSSSLKDSPNFWWEQPGRRAAHSTLRDRATGHRTFLLFFFGGIGTMPGMTIDAATMTLCHELGHVVGGLPHKDHHPDDEPMSIEAVADDYAARTCFKRMSRRVPTVPAPSPSLYVTNLCESRFPRSTGPGTSDPNTDRAYCVRAFRAIEFERVYGLEPEIGEQSFIELKDPTVVTEVNLANDYYPPTQCRVDTYVAGVLGEARPACWWVRAESTADRQ